MPEHSMTQLGGTMRLGERLSQITKPNTIVEKLYMSNKIYERHRHRYEVNPEYIKEVEAKGLHFVAVGAEKQGRKSLFLKHKPRMEVR